MRTSTSTLALAAAMAGLVPFAASAQEIIDNGTVQLGINPAGNLVTSGVGLNFLERAPASGEALAPGCACEGWGVGDMATGEFGMAGATFGITNLGAPSITVSGTGMDPASSGDSAVSTVSVNDGAFSMDIEHAFMPSASMNLYQVDVELTNTGAGAVGDLVYRRTMDWDVPPTEFSEFVTLQGWPATRLRASSDDGFVSGNPNVPLTAIAADSVVDGNFTDSGPNDHGAAFDFALGSVAAGDAETVTIYYGAAESEADAMIALGDVGAEVYSLGQPSAPGGKDLGEPNTFIFAFAGVGGTPVGPGGGGAASSILPGVAADLSYMTANHHLDAYTRRFNHLTMPASAGPAGTVSSRNTAPATGGAPGLRASPWNLQLAVQGTRGSMDTTTNNTGFDFNTRYIGASLDYALPANQLFDQTIIGAAIGYEEVDANLDAGMGSADGRERSISVYAAGVSDEGLFGDIQLMASDLDYDMTRVGILNNFSADIDGTRRAGRLRAGYNLDAGRIAGAGAVGTLGFYGEVTRSRVEFDTFTENNGGLTTQGFSDDQAILAAGTRYTFETAAQGGGRQFGYLDLALMADTMADDFNVTQTTAGGAQMQKRIDGRDGLMGRLEASYGFESDQGWYGSLDAGSTFGDGFSEGKVGFRVGLAF